MAQRRPAKKAAARRRPRPQPKGGSGVGVRGSVAAAATANAGNGWFSGWFKDLAIVRFGGSGGGSRGGMGSLLKAIQGGRAGAQRSGADDDMSDMGGVGCVDCGGGDYHAPGCGQAEPDDYAIDVEVEVIDDRPALGPGGVA